MNYTQYTPRQTHTHTSPVVAVDNNLSSQKWEWKYLQSDNSDTVSHYWLELFYLILYNLMVFPYWDLFSFFYFVYHDPTGEAFLQPHLCYTE